jgi:hypothetical protein
MHRPNRYASPCFFCKEIVPYMQGWLRRKVKTTPVSGNFIVVCKSCFELHKTELHPKHEVPMEGVWDMDKSPRKHMFNWSKKCDIFY